MSTHGVPIHDALSGDPFDACQPRTRAPEDRRRDGAPRSAAEPLRLTLRGKLLIVALLCLAPLLALTAGRALAATDLPRSGISVTVAPGETLWTIASRLAPGEDRRKTVARLIEFNHLTSPVLDVGQELTLPSPQ